MTPHNTPNAPEKLLPLTLSDVLTVLPGLIDISRSFHERRGSDVRLQDLYAEAGYASLVIENYAMEELEKVAPLAFQADMQLSPRGDPGLEVYGTLIAIDATVKHPELALVAFTRLRDKLASALGLAID